MIMISMVFGGILFIESTFYGDIKKQMSEESIKNEKLYYDYNASINGTLDMSLGLSKKDIEALNELDGVNEVIPYNTLYGRVKIQKNLLNENFIRYLEYNAYLEKDKYKFYYKPTKDSNLEFTKKKSNYNLYILTNATQFGAAQNEIFKSGICNNLSENNFLAFVDCVAIFISCLFLYHETNNLREKSSKFLDPYVLLSLFASILSLTIYVMNTVL